MRLTETSPPTDAHFWRWVFSAWCRDCNMAAHYWFDGIALYVDWHDPVRLLTDPFGDAEHDKCGCGTPWPKLTREIQAYSEKDGRFRPIGSRIWLRGRYCEGAPRCQRLTRYSDIA